MARSSRRLGTDDAELATRVAWLYYECSMTQSEIGAALGMPQTRVQRLIARAVASGIVRISIGGAMAECVTLERRVADRYGLQFCRVVPTPPDPDGAFSAIGRAGADYLTEMFETRRHRVLGVGHGRTVAAAIDHLGATPFPELTVISVLGDVPRRVGTNPFDVVHALAQKTGAAAYLPPVPFYANTPQDREVLFRQRGVAEAFHLAADAGLFMLGIGEVKPSAFLGMSGMVVDQEFADARRDGAVAEMLGTFFDAAGQRVETDLHDRVIALDPEVMRGREVVAMAGGADKRSAIDAALNSGIVTAFITDEQTASALTDGVSSSAATGAQTREREEQ